MAQSVDKMFQFTLSFLRRGFNATFSYHSWQASARMFQRLMDVVALMIFTLLLLNLLV